VPAAPQLNAWRLHQALVWGSAFPESRHSSALVEIRQPEAYSGWASIWHCDYGVNTK